jgi:hypothetical protein
MTTDVLIFEAGGDIAVIDMTGLPPREQRHYAEQLSDMAVTRLDGALRWAIVEVMRPSDVGPGDVVDGFNDDIPTASWVQP